MNVMKKIKLHIIAVTALIFAFSGSVTAQIPTCTVEGIVLTGESGTALTGSSIQIDGYGGVATDIYGRYSISGIATGVPVTISVKDYLGATKSTRTLILNSGINNVSFWVDAVQDAGGNYYSRIQIGEQVWMGENLKYLPQVNLSGTNSNSEPYYYVYGNESTDVDEAKSNSNYGTYGVIYNWPAAMAGCPVGWHLPTNDDWKQLEMSLGMTQIEADKVEWARGTNEGGKLKDAGILWESPNNGNE